MGRITKFYETYFKEISFVAVLILITAFVVMGTLYGEPPQLEPASVILWAVVFFIDVICLESLAQSHEELSRAIKLIRCCVITLYAVMLGAYLQLTPSADQKFSLTIILLGVVTVVVIELWHKKRKYFLSYIQDLRENHPYEYLEYLIKSGKELTEEQQMQMLQLPNGKKLVLLCIKQHFLCRRAEVELLLQSYALEVLGLYFNLYNFYIEAQLKMFKMPNVAKLVEMYINAGCEFETEGELELLACPDLIDLLEKYVDKHQLSPRAEVKLFDLPSAGFIKRYAEKYQLCDEAMAKAKALGYL